MVALAIQDNYLNDVYIMVLLSNLTLFLYTSCLNFSREIDYIWKKPFRLPTLFYLLTRYASIICFGMTLAEILFTPNTPKRTCDVVVDTIDVLTILCYVGIQGLLITRAHALCRVCSLPMWLKITYSCTIALFFFLGLTIDSYAVIHYGGCPDYTSSEIPGGETLIILLGDTCVFVTDFLVFAMGLYYFWDMWKLRVQKGNNLALIIFKETISRFLFSIVIIFLLKILSQFLESSPIFTTFQNGLAVLLLTEFTLDVRECHCAQNNKGDLLVVSPASPFDCIEPLSDLPRRHSQ